MKKYIFKLLRYSALPFLFRELIQKNKVTILMFHDIDKETAESTFSYLTEKYNIIGLDEFVDACYKKNKNTIPKKALIITFDDGHIGNIDILPIIKKYNIPTTFFLCAAIINTNRHYWFKFKNQLSITSLLKQKTNSERLEILSQIGFKQETEYGTPQALQEAHLDELRKCVNIQSHTMFHPILPKCSDEVAIYEIFKSKEMLEKIKNLNIDMIAYPNGDYSERDISLVMQAGYKCGLTTDYGFNTIKTDVFRLKRLSANDTSDLNELIVKSSGVWGFLKIKNGKFRGQGFTNSIQN